MRRPTPLLQSAFAVGLGVLVALAGGSGGEQVGELSVFAVCTIVAFVVNWIVFVPSFRARTEHFYDLTGSLTYVTVVVLSLLLVDEHDTRTVLLGVLILVWAARLGTFLFRRVRTSGKDGRFDKIKQDWARFLMAWTVQGLWVTFTAAAALAAITSGDKQPFGIVGVLGLLLWILGFGFEVVADRQKSAFRSDPDNRGRFIESGLWSLSRHPNYFGEFTLWTGVAVIAVPALDGWQYVTLLSPVFVYLLLTKVSGVPALEHRADEKWGGQPDYEAYKSSTPAFFPSFTRTTPQ